MSPLAADLVRKACGYAMAIALTLLLFRVLSRLATGTLSPQDPSIYGAAALAALGFLWARAARRVRARRSEGESASPRDAAGPEGPPP